MRKDLLYAAGKVVVKDRQQDLKFEISCCVYDGNWNKERQIKVLPSLEEIYRHRDGIQFTMEVDPTVDLCIFREYNIPC